MLPSDIMLRDDPHLRLHADEFLASESSFHESFAMAFKRVTELGFQFLAGSTTRHGSFECARAKQLRGGEWQGQERLPLRPLSVGV